MTVIYQTTITRIGQSAAEALSDQMLITFREGAPADIEEFCFIHCHGVLNGELKPGSQLELGETRYAVTAVGEVAEQNLRELQESLDLCTFCPRLCSDRCPVSLVTVRVARG